MSATHKERVFGGFDYDVYVWCTCGEELLVSHDEISIADIQRVVDAHREAIDNERD